MMLKKVLFHIGTPKTGTSIIQSHLAQNRAALRDRGFFYPVTISSHAHVYRTFESHHLLTYSWAGWEPFSLYDPDWFFRRARETCAAERLHTLLLSAENTWWLPRQLVGKSKPPAAEFWDAKRSYVQRMHGYLRDYDPQILVYVRRQDRWIESWYNQQVKNGNVLGRDLAGFVEHHDYLLDYGAQLDIWAEVFGRERVLVKVYEKEQLGAGLFEDFCATAGIGTADAYPLRRAARYNAQLERDALEFMQVCNTLSLDAADRHWLRLLVRRISNQFESRKVFHAQSLLDPAARRAVLERYAPVNERIAREYLGRPDGDLFREPWPALDEPWLPYPGLPLETALQFVLQIVMKVGSEEYAAQQRGEARRARLRRIGAALEPVLRPLLAAYHRRADDRLWRRHLWDHA